MPRKIHEYPGRDLTVRYDLSLCIHAGECVRRAPEVFDPKARPWVAADEASAQKIAEVVDCCPTGALHAVSPAGEPLETEPAEATITLRPNGPLYVRGRTRIERMSGEAFAEDSRFALCRCGASSNKPFCDGAHRDAEFRDSGKLGRPAGSAEPTASGPLTVRPAPNGPLLVNGPCTLHGAGDSTAVTKAALCRCGLSENKPYCDGAHATGKFQAE